MTSNQVPQLIWKPECYRELMMINCDTLNSGSLYKIEGEGGIWYDSHQGYKNRENKYYFWRDAVKNIRKVTINLSQMQVQKKVSETGGDQCEK